MARNKYPEETIKKILDISFRLFLEKGYENTSIQDIVDQLGMSKGAIYHHFKSKEEILDQVCTVHYGNLDYFYEILNSNKLNGKEKLKKIFTSQLENEEKRKVDSLTPALLKNPKMVVNELDSTMHYTALELAKVIEEGNQDGSLHISQPQETAEVALLLINFWINPALFPVDEKRFLAKLHFYKNILDHLQLPIVDEELLSLAQDYFRTVIKKPG